MSDRLKVFSYFFYSTIPIKIIKSLLICPLTRFNLQRKYDIINNAL